MSMGSDYTSGVAIGQRQKQFEASQGMDYLSMLQNSKRPMGGSIALGRSESGEAGGGTLSAKDIYLKAAEESLNRKDAELKTMTEQARANEAAQRQREMERINYYGERAREEEARADKFRAQAASETEAINTKRKERYVSEESASEKFRGEYKALQDEREQKALNDAMRGLYSYQSGPVKAFFDNYGESGITIKGITKGPSGEVIVDFGEGKSETYSNPVEAVQRLLIPAAAIMAQITAQASGKASQGQKSQDNLLEAKYKKNLDIISGIAAASPEDRQKAIEENQRIEQSRGISIGDNAQYSLSGEATGMQYPKEPGIYINDQTGEKIIVNPDGTVTRVQ